MVRISPLPPTLDAGPFHVQDALQSGVSPGRLRASDLHAPLRGVRIAAAAPALQERCSALLCHRDDRLLFSHVTAAQLYGAPLPRHLDMDDPIHVTVPAGERAPQIAGIHSHTIASWSPALVGAFPVTSPAQTWLDLVPLLDRVSSIAVADYLVSGSAPWTTRDHLESIVAAWPGRRGVKQARAQLPAVRAGVDSPGETRLRLLLTDAGLPQPAVNFTLLDRTGTAIARADLAYPIEQIALEYEGDIHRVDRRVWMKDLRRRERVEDLGWRMVRVTASDLHEPAALLTRMRKLLARRE
ncbi:hypothetical protein [Leifsonia aquatica]|uniref:hypothetical protein n=1 Tax=Leifsonia aquatica TaxID=144185 RepID=UPI00382BFBC0